MEYNTINKKLKHEQEKITNKVTGYIYKYMNKVYNLIVFKKILNTNEKWGN